MAIRVFKNLEPRKPIHVLPSILVSGLYAFPRVVGVVHRHLEYTAPPARQHSVYSASGNKGLFSQPKGFSFRIVLDCFVQEVFLVQKPFASPAGPEVC